MSSSSTMVVLVMGVMCMGAMCMSSVGGGYLFYNSNMLCQLLPELCSTPANQTTPSTDTSGITGTGAPVNTGMTQADCTATAKDKCTGTKGKKRESCISKERKKCTAATKYCVPATDQLGKLLEGDNGREAVLSIGWHKDATLGDKPYPIIQWKNNDCGYNDGINQHKFVSVGNKKYKILTSRLDNTLSAIQAECSTWPYVRYGDGKKNAEWYVESLDGDCGKFVLRNAGCKKYLGPANSWDGKAIWTGLTDKAGAQRFKFDTSC